MERSEVQLYLQTPYVGGVLPKTGITVSQGVPSLITYRCTKTSSKARNKGSIPTTHPFLLKNQNSLLIYFTINK
jgi:hypothetical protein